MTREDFETLSFAKIWIKNISPLKLEIALRELVERNALINYPVLKEISNSKVAQWEEVLLLNNIFLLQ